MTWINLGEPKPRLAAQPYMPFVWPTVSSRHLPHPSLLPDASFASLTAARRSRRTFGTLTIEQISQWLWLAMRVQLQSDGHDSQGLVLTRRPSPSAGAIHPIEVLMLLDKGQDWQRYAPLDHALQAVANSNELLLQACSDAAEILPNGGGATILLVAEPGKTLAKYENGASLVWRDAGVLMGYLSMAAQALGLNMCLLGCMGGAAVESLDEQGRLVGVGMAVLGSTP